MLIPLGNGSASRSLICWRQLRVDMKRVSRCCGSHLELTALEVGRHVRIHVSLGRSLAQLRQAHATFAGSALELTNMYRTLRSLQYMNGPTLVLLAFVVRDRQVEAVVFLCVVL